MLRQPHVALVTEDGTQAKAIEDLLRNYVVLAQARGVSDLPELLRTREFDALFCGQFVRGGSWKDALEAIRTHKLDLPVIVLSRTGGEKEWVEVIEAGAFDLLVPPFGTRQLLSVMEHAAESENAKRGQGRTFRVVA